LGKIGHSRNRATGSIALWEQVSSLLVWVARSSMVSATRLRTTRASHTACPQTKRLPTLPECLTSRRSWI